MNETASCASFGTVDTAEAGLSEFDSAYGTTRGTKPSLTWEQKESKPKVVYASEIDKELARSAMQESKIVARNFTKEVKSLNLHEHNFYHLFLVGMMPVADVIVKKGKRIFYEKFGLCLDIVRVMGCLVLKYLIAS